MYYDKNKRMRPLPDMAKNFQAKNRMFQYLRTSKQKIYWQYAWVFTQLDVNSLKVKFFRHVAMNRHIKSVRFTTKIRKTRNIRPCFSNSGDNTAVSQLCNFSYKTTLLPPKQFSCWTYIYARILNWVAFIVLPSSYARILSWVAFIVLPSSLPAQITSLFSSCACKFVACFFDYTYLWNLCSYYCGLKKNSWL